MIPLRDARQVPFNPDDFDAQLTMMAPEYRESLKTLYRVLSECEYLQQHPRFLNCTGPIVISGFAAERRGDPATRKHPIAAAIPFTDPVTGISLEFGVRRPFQSETLEIFVQLRRQGGVDLDSLLDVREHAELNQLDGFQTLNTMIFADDDLAERTAEVVGAACRMLERHLQSCVTGQYWPYRIFQRFYEVAPEQFIQEIQPLTDSGLVDRRGMTLLLHAVTTGRTDLVKRLLETGADPNFRCPNTFLAPDYRLPGYSALHLLAVSTHLRSSVAVELAEILCDRGADVNQISHDNSTPLGLASSMIWVDLVRCLLRRGAKKLGQGWDSWARYPAPSIDVQILDQLLRSALGQASRLRR